ncbi:hypothetical protein DSO57_1022512 [Entomophthora muscae]|uniref:Uncharacterized protein n=1 Tax=Entomophthora muscae TaxID=34485 RepID=A0ACC2S561_9FUNG|nr:hypothetical protein DSO57_1022512 [Entomophthora muscae]
MASFPVPDCLVICGGDAYCTASCRLTIAYLDIHSADITKCTSKCPSKSQAFCSDDCILESLDLTNNQKEAIQGFKELNIECSNSSLNDTSKYKSCMVHQLQTTEASLDSATKCNTNCSSIPELGPFYGCSADCVTPLMLYINSQQAPASTSFSPHLTVYRFPILIAIISILL